MSVTVDLSPDEVAQIMRFTGLKNVADAVAKAARVAPPEKINLIPDGD